MKLLTLTAIALYGFNNLSSPSSLYNDVVNDDNVVIGEISRGDLVESPLWVVSSYERYQFNPPSISQIFSITNPINLEFTFSTRRNIVCMVNSSDFTYKYYSGLSSLYLTYTPTTSYNGSDYLYEFLKTPYATLTFSDNTSIDLRGFYCSDLFSDFVSVPNNSGLFYRQISFRSYGDCPLKSVKMNDIYPFFNFGSGYSDKYIISSLTGQNAYLNANLRDIGLFYNGKYYQSFSSISYGGSYDSENWYYGLENVYFNEPNYIYKKSGNVYNTAYNALSYKLFNASVRDTITNTEYNILLNNFNGDTFYYFDNPSLSYRYGSSYNYPLTLNGMFEGLFNLSSDSLTFGNSSDFNNLFTLFGSAFRTWASIFSLSIGGISLSIFIFAPLLVAFLVFLIHLVKRG